MARARLPGGRRAARRRDRAPDHPQIAPQSRGALFDNTEIEEALRLHVLTLSDGERAEIAGGDPAVREMVEKALRTTPQDILALHGVMRPVGGDPREGESEAFVDGVAVRRGDKLALRLGDRTDPYDRMLDGRTTTLERIYVDYDGKTYFGVTVDSDPMQEVLRESGRYSSSSRARWRWSRDPSTRPTDGSHSATRPKQILVAAVGNLWLRRRLRRRGRQASPGAGAPAGVHVFDFGTGGLDLAYEVMRATTPILVDASRQGRRAGHPYVMEADEDSVEGGIEDGDVINPHGMDPQTVLRFVKTVGLAGQGGRRRVRACAGGGDGDRTQPVGRGGRRPGGRGRRVDDPGAGGGLMHELSIASAVVATVEKPRRRPHGRA